MLGFYRPVRLLLDFGYDLGNGNPGIGHGKDRHTCRNSSPAGSGLPEPLAAVSSAEIDDRADLTDIDPGHQGRDQDYRQACSMQCSDGAFLFLEKRPASQFFVNVVIDAVELQEDGRQPCPLQTPEVVRVPGQAQAIGIDLDKVEPEGPPKTDNLRQVVAQRRLPCGKCTLKGLQLQGVSETCPESFADSGRESRAPAGIGKTIVAVQVAPPGDLDQRATGLLAMFTGKGHSPGDSPVLAAVSGVSG